MCWCYIFQVEALKTYLGAKMRTKYLQPLSQLRCGLSEIGQCQWPSGGWVGGGGGGGVCDFVFDVSVSININVLSILLKK